MEWLLARAGGHRLPDELPARPPHRAAVLHARDPEGVSSDLKAHEELRSLTRPRSGAMISVHGLTKNYGAFAAVKGIDFEVRAGEVFALLGPNGAGKTTTVEILEGLRPRTGGEVSVLGFDPGTQSRNSRTGSACASRPRTLPDKMKVREAVDLFGEPLLAPVDAVRCSSVSSSGTSADAVLRRSFRAARSSASRSRSPC